MPFPADKSTDEVLRRLKAALPIRPLVIECVDDDMAALLRTKTSAERTQIAYHLWRFARDTIYHQVASQHPDWSPEEVQRETGRRLLHET